MKILIVLVVSFIFVKDLFSNDPYDNDLEGKN